MSSSSKGSSSKSSGGLGARLEAKLDAATRRTQALADAVEESLAASSSSSAGLDGGGLGPLPLPLPTPLRSLVAQLLSVGGQQQQEQQQRPPEEEDRPSAPVLVELRGAGLGQGMSSAVIHMSATGWLSLNHHFDPPTLII